MTIAALSLVACTAKPAPMVREVAGEPEVIELGERRPGELKWMSANARLVALYVYADEESRQRHGMDVPPLLMLYDTVEGTRRMIEEIVATDPRGRWAVALAGKHLWLLDGETGARDDLAARGADLTGDRQRCWGQGRQAIFDPWGSELLYLRTDPDRAVIRRLRDGQEREVAAPPYKLWRAEPTGAPGWVRFLVVPRDTDGDGALTFPWRDHTCEPWIDWRDWDDVFMTQPTRMGDLAAVVLADADGARVHSGYGAVPQPMKQESGEPWVPFGADMYGLFGVTNEVVRADGTSVGTPAECDWSQQFEAVAAALVCPEGMRELRSVSGGVQTIAGLQRLFMRPALGRDGALWSAAWVKVDGREQLGRIDLAGGSLELGRGEVELPRDEYRVAQDRRGWLVGGGRAYQVTTGRSRRMPAHEKTRQAGMIEIDNRVFALDLEGARMLPLASRPKAVAENGCALVAPGGGESDIAGTWALICPPGRALRLDRDP
ncbi:hypothetical protein [Nannocystis punicea]|uniref:Lipoprotein n=1 Tax=Nannocystis punicea TaxID=2995304 RepID=A0ABY7GVC4_9BACT|nr:hypothetical protein [Nannocystis poenicansa]WAS90912.1 hypothetical protein O0S08_32385 [Nannocystis poenicansa]